MSSTINYAALFNISGGTSDNLLNAIYGIGNTASVGIGNPLTALKTAETNQTKDIAATAREPKVASDIAAFRRAVASAKTPTALLNNPIVLKVLLTANGLADQLKFTALAQKALLSDVKKPGSLAVKLADTRWKPVVTTFDFANKGLAVIQDPKVLTTIANAYAEITWRTSLDTTNPGLSNALSFRSRAATITSADQVLGDPVLRDVVTTALNIPLEIAFQSLTTQEKVIAIRLDFKKLKDPHFVDTLTQQYLLNKASQKQNTSNGQSLDSLAISAAGLTV